jgi:hypothetical protein
MQSSKNFAIKDRITHAIFTGAAVMLVVFSISLFLPKEWLVSGKVVVFPSGQPASASQNLLAEVGNTAEIIKGASFQKSYFPDQLANFAGARVLKNSSMVQVKFRSNEADIQMYEDLIVKVPGEVDEYARDLYGGSPFKYKMAGDPEISASPVRPNLLLNAIFGFLGGVLLYIIYWLGFESLWPESEEPASSADKAAIEKDEIAIVSPEIKSAEPAFLAEKPAEEKNPIEKKIISPKGQSAAPENLPFVDELNSSSDAQEPSDDEVKERLNRLMRGEL